MLKPIEWDSIHASNLRAFLLTESGQRAVELLTSLRPALLAGEHADQTLVRTGEVRGYELCLSLLTFITTPEFSIKPPPATDNYPDIDDDSKWGEKT